MPAEREREKRTQQENGFRCIQALNKIAYIDVLCSAQINLVRRR